ncbi:MAG: putative sulfate exporter family transporter [Chloroflexi bacterium]|nr:putative sulfate exporter family transporter [Chloroflexota bacterium]
MTTAKPEAKQPVSTNGPINIIAGLVLVVVLAWLALQLKLMVYNVKDIGLGIPGKALEYPLWAAILGLVVNFLLKAVNLHEFVKAGIRTELFLKIGLVLLGATVSFMTILTAAGGAVIQGIIMIACVYMFCWWLAGKFGLSDSLRAVMSTAISICGVSAAIAAAGSVLAKKEEITYITALVIVTALPLMVISPLIASAIGLPEPVAGAWFGGNVDTTAAVVGAGTIYGKTAQQIATIVKSTQNAFIGVVAFILALYFTTVVEKGKEKPSAGIIWQRFPKFVLGFIIVSILFTVQIIPKPLAAAPFNATDAILFMKDWFFCFAFVCMGLELSVGELKKMGWSPVIVYLIVTVFNTLLALGVSWIIFGYLFPVKM